MYFNLPIIFNYNKSTNLQGHFDCFLNFGNEKEIAKVILLCDKKYILCIFWNEVYRMSINWNIIFCCSSVKWDQRSNKEDCDFVKYTGIPSSAKSCERVIPKAAQIFSREGTVGIIFFRYQEDIVDCGRPACSASWHSVHPLAALCSAIALNISSFGI